MFDGLRIGHSGRLVAKFSPASRAAIFASNAMPKRQMAAGRPLP
jgi:hypothetical protein